MPIFFLVIISTQILKLLVLESKLKLMCSIHNW